MAARLKASDLEKGTRLWLEGNSTRDFWMDNYRNIHISSGATVVSTPRRIFKKVMVVIDELGGEKMVRARVCVAAAILESARGAEETATSCTSRVEQNPTRPSDLEKGTRVWLEGETADFWIADYPGIRLSSGATVVETPRPYARKVAVIIDSIGDDVMVAKSVRVSQLALQ